MIYFCGFLPDYHKKTRASGLFSFARGAVFFRKAQILLRVRRDARPLFRRERAYDAVRVAEHERARGYLLAPRDKRPRADHAVLPDPRAVEDDAAHADQRVVPDFRPVHHRVVPDRDVVAEHRGRAVPDVHRRVVLHVGIPADDDGRDVPADTGAAPDIGAVAEGNVARHIRGFMDKYLFPLFYAFPSRYS